MSLLKVFSGSCLSLDDLDIIQRPKFVERPHLLGPGVDFFTEDGQPVRPQPSAQTLHKVFSGSALDLNAMGDPNSDEELSSAPASSSPPPAASGATVSTIFSQISHESEVERNKNARSKVTILVVGGSGYVANHVVAKLLDTGYTVRMTVADALDEQQELELYSISPEAGKRLTIVEADITSATALKELIRGCRYVVHCGVSPGNNVTEGQVVKVHNAAVGALFDAIRLLGKPSVKRVVITGSAAAVFNIRDPPPPSGKFDESNWNKKADPKLEPVPYAKITFENEAWRLQKMFGVELVVILPSIVIGPSRTHEISEAMRTINDLASGSPYFPFAPNMHWNFVDVRDVAEAHVRAIENADIKDQRIIVSNECLSLSEIGQLIKKAFPHLHPPTMSAPTLLTLIVAPLTHARVRLAFIWRNLGVKKVLDNSKAVHELGLEFTAITALYSRGGRRLRAAEQPTTKILKTDQKPFAALSRLTRL